MNCIKFISIILDKISFNTFYFMFKYKFEISLKFTLKILYKKGKSFKYNIIIFLKLI